MTTLVWKHLNTDKRFCLVIRDQWKIFSFNEFDGNNWAEKKRQSGLSESLHLLILPASYMAEGSNKA